MNRNTDLTKLKHALNSLLQKEAFAPMPAGPPPTDPAMMGGAPPMDPAMMGGAPPMDPAMMGGMPPMDPAMMGGAPPMDPAAMGGMPPMDPAAMGGMPPMDPAMMGGMPPAPGGETVTVTMEDLKAILAEASGNDNQPDATGKTAKVSNKDLGSKIDELTDLVYMMANNLGVAPPVEETGGMAPMEGEANPEDIAAALGAGAAPPLPSTDPAMMGGMPPMDPAMMGGAPPMDPAAIPKQAAVTTNPFARMLLNLKNNQ